ncbi:ATP-binding cassette domain-containing protein [Virgibacillus sp. MSP4-1]|uniref:phosphonate ABC transporter ATP-binding protein n=1 Tax=Virgibacillus sp. MSP4-1 TaxID=2700081 RepID=UPI0003A6F62E|nr:ATP-binding cassette domain-containing protein [Virgibacillus sp. MSP4-1]QHS21473.1 ATP-binding cassette domain-containing protein [Virgibacillus sp. MSP4-1]
MESTDAFTLENVEKIYGEMKAISPLSLDIKQGEVTAIIGPSGAGKTTLLNMLSTIETPDHGTIRIAEKRTSEYRNPKVLAKKVGIIRQQFDLVGSLPVIHNVLVGRFTDWGFWKSFWSFFFPQEKDIALQALQRVGLAAKMYDRTSKLSGGEQQRVALARLLVQHPEIILADEPVSSLDPARAEDIIRILAQFVKEKNQTLVASLHSVELARNYFDRIIALREGKVYFDQRAADVSDADLTNLYQLTELNEHADQTPPLS